jgi:amino acid permease
MMDSEGHQDQEPSQSVPPESRIMEIERVEASSTGDVSTSSERGGTTASARFNILSTMVGGGSLSLPLAFQKSGNALLGPFLLILVAGLTEFCFRTLIASARTLSPVSPSDMRVGKDSFESIASAAFGKKAYLVSTLLVTAMCFFGTVGYAVLLRDMLQPISDVVFSTSVSGPTLANNATMLMVVFLVTPLCTLKTLTALKRFGAASMCSVLILGTCIVYRSVQCNMGVLDGPSPNWSDSFQFFPDKWKDVLDVFPIFVSCFVCHYNLPTVHNELRNPSQERVSWWLWSTTWGAATFYMIMGVAGSAYASCTATGTLHGNVLLDFRDDDPLLLVGRMCLAFTITMAFPMLTIPARDILIQSLPAASYWKSLKSCWRNRTTAVAAVDDSANTATNIADTPEAALHEPLLDDEENSVPIGLEDEAPAASYMLRLMASISVFWTAALVASCVSSIDIVWDFLGSSLSILMSYLIPCGSYLVISRMRRELNEQEPSWRERLSAVLAWVLIIIFIPLSFVSTGNAIYNNFF